MSVSLKSDRTPKYCRQVDKHRPDRAYVRINGKKILLGLYDSPESIARYKELTGQAEPKPPEPVGEVTVAMVMAGYLEYAERYYRRPAGEPCREYEMIRQVLKYVRKNCSELPAKDFGPKRLKDVRQMLVEADQSRKYINKNIARPTDVQVGGGGRNDPPECAAGSGYGSRLASRPHRCPRNVPHHAGCCCACRVHP